MTVYYNEFDPFKAQWLRHLIEEGVIAKGVVDERPVQSVEPADLVGYDQHHFFAGIGVWSYALRRAGWPDDEPIWTGSCPCQPFSLAGKQDGFADPRHVWPEWFRLVRVCRPDRILGEQVASAGAWVDLIQSDLEGHGYAFGSPDLPAAGFGGAHIRQRFMWVADAHDTERWAERAPWNDGVWPATGRIESHGHASERGDLDRVADTDGGVSGNGGLQPGGKHGQQQEDSGFIGGLADTLLPGRPERGSGAGSGSPSRSSSIGGLAFSCDVQPRRGVLGPRESESESARASCERSEGLRSPSGVGNNNSPGPSFGPIAPDERGAVRFQGATAGPASPLFGCDWLFCHDAKWRPVEPGTFPLVDASPQRVGRLRGYGDAIDAEALTQFIGAYMDALYDVF